MYSLLSRARLFYIIFILCYIKYISFLYLCVIYLFTSFTNNYDIIIVIPILNPNCEIKVPTFEGFAFVNHNTLNKESNHILKNRRLPNPNNLNDPPGDIVIFDCDTKLTNETKIILLKNRLI